VTDTAGAGYNRGGAAVLKDAYWETAGEHYSIPIRLKKGTGNGVQGGDTGKAGACWLFDPEDPALSRHRLLAVDDTVYADSTPIAGVLNPDTKALDPNGEYFYFGREPIWHTRAGAYSRYISNGGGGWGSAKTREPERVLSDVRNGYVSVEGARAMYGVVVTGDPENDPEGIAVDAEATRVLRATGVVKLKG
jgi:N-methylhydantoinase B